MTKPTPALSRRAAIKVAGAIAASVAAAGRLGIATEAHDLTPDDPAYDFREYEHFTSHDAKIRQVYQWPNVKNPIIFGNTRNGLNGWQFSYGGDPDEMRVVVQAYASANVALFDDYVWNKYKVGEKVDVKDGTAFATRNVFYKSPHPAPPGDEPPVSRTAPFYSDVSIEGLQRRGVLFLI